MIKSIHRRSLPGVRSASNRFPITTMNAAAFIFSRHNRTTLASFWLCALLFMLGTSHLQAQFTPFDDLPVLVVRLLPADEMTIENGTFFADGHYVSGNNGFPIPRNVLTWTPAQFAAANGKPLYPADNWEDVTALYSKFRHSTEIYNWVDGTPLYIISAAGGSASPGTVVAWGANLSGETTVPAGLSGVTAIAAGVSYTVALKNNGTVVAWGRNDNGQTTVPVGLSGVAAITVGDFHTVALKNNGTVVAWGWNFFGQTTIPAGLSGVTAIAAGYGHTVALKGDGTVAAWGYNSSGQTTVPPGLSGVTAIAAGNDHTVVLKSDGTIMAWGGNGAGQTTIPAGLSGVTAIAAGFHHTVALKSDGTVVAWGYNSDGTQTTVPAGLSGVTAIATGGGHIVALKSNGSVTAWGRNDYGQTAVPVGLSGVTAIAGGAVHTVALVGGAVIVTDTNNPTLTITAPTAGQRWSNAVFTVTGTASDNVRVANVRLQLNGGGLMSATTANVWTNWSAALNLNPGTNTVAVYSVDTSGNVSSTTNRSFDYVVTNRLVVQALGLGTISPNYSNSWLEVGRNYSMTATPTTGFAFSNWTLSTNWLGGRITNNATVQFMMASNLTLQINFADVTKPTLTVSAPTAGQKMTNALAKLTGTASDNWKVAGVWYQLNSNSWNLATTANNFANWTNTVTLVTGTNTLKFYALDLGGNFSTTNSFSIVSSNTFSLQLAFTNALPMKTNGLVFSLQLSKGLNGIIQVSSNLTSWATLTNFVGTNTTLNFRDPAATNANRRFYRAVIP